MIATAKQLALNPDNKAAHSKWQQANNEVNISSSHILIIIILILKLIDAVGNVHEILHPSTLNLANGIAQISFNQNSRSCTLNINY